MPKHKAGVVLATYEGTNVDWGTLRGAALREGLHDFQSGKKLRPIVTRRSCTGRYKGGTL